MSAEKFNVGDKVLVKSLDWYNDNKDALGTVNVPCGFVEQMSKYCGKVLTIRYKGWRSYDVAECGFNWSDEMFERALSPVEVFAETNDVKYLPKDLEGCANVLEVSPEVCTNGYMSCILTYLQELYICRDAYWKLANNWKPDWTDMKTKKHCVVIRRNKISVATSTETSRAFAFPTPEMAEMFMKNFASKLNLCREML